MPLFTWWLVIFRELFPSSIDRYATVKVVNGTKSGFFYWRNYNHSMNLMIIGNDCCRRIWSEVSEILVIGDHWRFATSTGQRLNKIWIYIIFFFIQLNWYLLPLILFTILNFPTFCHDWNRPMDNPFSILILILMYEEQSSKILCFFFDNTLFESPIPVFHLVKTMNSRQDNLAYHFW